MKGIAVVSWRDDVGAYIFSAYPESIKEILEDYVMNLYNAHRFRSTEKNFQMMKRSGFNAASFYSGGYQSNYIGKPNYCVTLLLGDEENPVEYERVLIKVTNNLLTKLDDDDFDYLLMDMFQKLDAKEFDEIKVDRGAIDLDEESPAPKKKFATTSSISMSEEEKIFADLMDSTEFSADTEKDSKLADFESAGSAGGATGTDPFAEDPFSGGGGGGGGATADPFGGGGGGPKAAPKANAFAEDPFATSQKPDLAKAFGIDETIGKRMFKETKSSAADIIRNLDLLESKKPEPPADPSDKEKNYEYLKDLVDFLEEKVKILGTLVTSVRELEKAQEEKDAIIGKLLLLVKGD